MKQPDGFLGQRTIVIPDYILDKVKNDPLNQPLHITDIGYFPKAYDHYRSRLKGCSQNILIYCIEGKGWIAINNQRIAVNPNQYFIIPQNTPHTYAADKHDPWSIFWIHFSGTHASLFINDLEQAQSITPSRIDRIEERIQLFEEMIINLEMGYSFENIAYANICLWHFLASFKYLSQFRQIHKTKDLDMAEQSIQYMKRELKTKLSLQQLADQAGLSASYYTAEFKRKTGRPPLDYLIHLKIQHACQLLDHSKFKIKEICNMVGFNDQYYFSRVFNKIMGMSPKQYRKQLKG